MGTNENSDRNTGRRFRFTRRDFLKLGAGAFIAAAGTELLAIISRYLAPRSSGLPQGGVIAAGPTERFDPGSVTEFPENGFFLVRAADGGFLAVYRRCPHLGCNVHFESPAEAFICPCHASAFDKHGDYSRPPVPRALDLYTVSFQDDFVLVDTSRPIQREHFHPDQLAYPSITGLT